MTKVFFMGRKPVAAKCLEYLCDHTDVEVVGVMTDTQRDVSPTSDVARERGIRLLSFDETLCECQSGTLQFDLGVSMLFWRKIKGALLHTAPRGIVNFHPAPLPEYKGVGGYNLAILKSLTKWGCAAHYVDQGIDTGDIISVRSFPISPETETAFSLEAKSQQVLYELFVSVFERVLAAPGRLATTPNDGGISVSRPELEAMKAIDVDKDDIARKIRAFWFPPYDGAYLEIRGQKFTLVDRTVLNQLEDPSLSSLFAPNSTP